MKLLLALLLHDFLLLCYFFISHPLLLAYLLLLFPYLFKLLFLIYPLLLSTFLLLLLAHLTSTSSESPATTSSAILSFLRAKLAADKGEQVCFTEQLSKLLDGDCSSQNRNFLMLQRDGSVRKGREWKRTLACKLFEERMSYRLCEERKAVEGAEEMDLLWEAYEVVGDKSEKQRRKEKVEEEEEEDEDEGDIEERGISGQLCCLQALKLSAVKVNLGVGRPRLVKVSMAFKGISLFRRAGRRKITN